MLFVDLYCKSMHLVICVPHASLPDTYWIINAQAHTYSKRKYAHLLAFVYSFNDVFCRSSTIYSLFMPEEDFCSLCIAHAKVSVAKWARSEALNKLWFDVYACVCHFRFGKYNLCTGPAMFQMQFRSSAIQIVRDLVHLLEERQIAASLSTRHCLLCGSNNYIWVFEYSLNSLPPNPSLHTRFHRVSTISHLHWTTENRTCYMQKALLFVDTPKVISCKL